MSQTREVPVGTCKVCGCTEERACLRDGHACSWWDIKKTLCNYCAPTIHHCHANYCGEEIPRNKLMCRRHWDLVPQILKDAILNTYQPGQERGCVRPSRAYIMNVMEAKRTVAALEGLLKP